MDLGEREAPSRGERSWGGTEPPSKRDAVVLAAADCSDRQHFNAIHSTVGHWLPTVRARGRVEQTAKLGGA